MIPAPTRSGTDGRTLDAILANASPETRATIEVLGEILEWHLAPLGLSIDYDTVARALEGATGADVKEVVRRTVLEYGERFT